MLFKGICSERFRDMVSKGRKAKDLLNYIVESYRTPTLVLKRSNKAPTYSEATLVKIS